jgi:tRNA-uridine 2-sulfurtransferase
VETIIPFNAHELLEQTIQALRMTPDLRPGDPVIAAMSGGVDSSVMAALLHRAGFQVVGVSMHLHGKGQAPESEAQGRCCTLDDFQDARRVAYEMGFPHYVLDFTSRFQQTVIDPFVASYLKGETPSPCILCNQHLKFDALVHKADELGIRFIATGHYARIRKDPDGYHLLKAQDAAKDQSYFLFQHTQATLARTLFPLAQLSKPEVRAIGATLGLHLSEKPESQEICFVHTRRYDQYIEEKGMAPDSGSGPIRHVEDGRELGTHSGFWRYTVGQRKGLQIAHSEPLYVIRLEPSLNTVWVGEQRHLGGVRLVAREVNWCVRPPQEDLGCMAKIRSRSREAPARIHLLAEHRVSLEIAEPQLAITPGQAVVFYQGDEVLGGGWIEG